MESGEKITINTDELINLKNMNADVAVHSTAWNRPTIRN